jgi:hypothetical protein
LERIAGKPARPLRSVSKNMGKNNIFDKESVNLAANAAASCSAQCQADCGADKAVDGDIMSTRWMTPDEKREQWIQLDLGESKAFNHVRMYWGAIYASAYVLECSQDGEQWSVILDDRYSQGGKQNLLLSKVYHARYVRLWVKESSNTADAKMVLYALELYLRDMERIANRAADGLEVPSLIGRNFYLPMEWDRDGVFYRWSSDFPAITVDSEKAQATVRRGAQRQTGTLKAEITAGSSTVTREFTVAVRAQSDAAADYCIIPTPQHMECGEEAVALTGPVIVVADKEVDETVKQRAKEVLQRAGLTCECSEASREGCACLLLGVAGAAGEAGRCHAAEGSAGFFETAQEKFDRHFLRVDENGGKAEVVILGETSDAVYYGLATLEQMLEQSAPGALTKTTVYDYSDTQYRGFIEGFYGYPWDVDDRISLMEYGKRYKMNLFIYGPKSDPYHLGSWRDDYPVEITDKQREQGQITQQDIRRLAEEAKKNHINFVWSVHPAMQNGVDLSSEETVDQGVEAVLRKFSHLYSLGVRGFALFVDDIDLQEAYVGSEMQARMVDLIQKGINRAYRSPDMPSQDRVTPLFYVPSYYALDFGEKEKREHNLTCLQSVDPDVVITITGGGCWSIVENQALNTYHGLLGRKPLMWWNYPVNDNIDDTMQMGLMDSVYSVSNDVDDLLGIMSNPMNQAEASKISLFGLADYSWNTKAFEPRDNWERSFASMTDDESLAAALRVFAENSSIGHEPTRLMKLYDGFQSGYQRGGQAPDCTEQLRTEMERIIAACDQLEEMAGGQDERLKALWGEIKPWACKLRAMAEIGFLGIKAAVCGDDREAQWCSLLAKEKYKGLLLSREYETHSIKGHGTQLEEKDFPVRVSQRRLGEFLRFLMDQVLR